ncbi:MAG TPA: ABC transporter substrate-binding protein [Firmicutes bacterium]|nr:ABC transporter substrate-binding protein [Bacillota bacterium]
MRFKLYIAVVSALLLLALGVPALAAATDPKTFVFVTFGDVDSLDPAYAYDTASGEVIHQLYDNLVAYEGGSLDKIIPMLATQVPSKANGLISQDGLTVKFPIRKGVKFHNGDVLTPADVEYTFERAMLADPAGGPVWMFFEPLLGVQTLREVIAKAGGPGVDAKDFDAKKLDAKVVQKVYDIIDKTVEVEGDYVVFHLAKPYPAFLQILAKGGSWSSIVNKKWMVENGAWDGKATTWPKWYDQAKEEMTLYQKAMGTGPFRLLTWDRNAGQIILKRFDDYWRGPAKLETVFIKYVEEANTRMLMLQTGEADAAVIQQQYLDQIRNVKGIVVKEHLPYIGNTALLFNYTIPVQGNEDIVGSGKLDGNGVPPDFFADIHVRKAFNYAFDYETYIKEVAMGAGSKPYGPAPAVLPFVNKNRPWYSFDLKKAEEEFKQAFGGELWKKGFKLTILYNTGNEQRKTAAEILEANIESINPKFKIDVQGMQWSTYLSKLRASALPVFFMGWHMDFPDAHNFYMPYMHSAGAFAGYTGQGMVDLAKAKFDALIEQAISTYDNAKRQELYYKLQDLAYEYAVAVFYIEPEEHRVYRDWVKGVVYNPAYSANYDFYTIYKEVR